MCSCAPRTFRRNSTLADRHARRLHICNYSLKRSYAIFDCVHMPIVECGTYVLPLRTHLRHRLPFVRARIVELDTRQRHFACEEFIRMVAIVQLTIASANGKKTTVHDGHSDTKSPSVHLRYLYPSVSVQIVSESGRRLKMSSTLFN